MLLLLGVVILILLLAAVLVYRSRMKSAVMLHGLDIAPRLVHVWTPTLVEKEAIAFESLPDDVDLLTVTDEEAAAFIYQHYPYLHERYLSLESKERRSELYSLCAVHYAGGLFTWGTNDIKEFGVWFGHEREVFAVDAESRAVLPSIFSAPQGSTVLAKTLEFAGTKPLSTLIGDSAKTLRAVNGEVFDAGVLVATVHDFSFTP
jgi:hypothetical protein